MVQIETVASYCDELLATTEFGDYAPNGVQVTSSRAIAKLVTGVTASRGFLEAALAAEADAALVHHGYFWKGEDQRITGMKAGRLRLLLANDLGLLVYHLPLDAHQIYGNNAQLARRLGLRPQARHQAAGIPGLLMEASFDEPVASETFYGRLSEQLGCRPLHVGYRAPVQRVALCTGAGQRFLAQAASLGVDAMVSGEISEPTTHEARELGVQFFAAGHHATERDGPRALGEHLAERFGLRHEFVDDDNPV